MRQNSSDPCLGSFRDDDLGDVLVLDRADLPTLSEAKAADWLGEYGIPCTWRNLAEARKRGEITATLIGKTFLYSKRSLIVWVESRRGAQLQRTKGK